MKHTRIMCLIMVMILAALLCVPAMAEEPTTLLSGKVGDDAYYSYDVDTGIITISGTGSTYYFMPREIDSFYPYSPLPYIEEGGYKINALVVEDGITKLETGLLCDTSCKYIEIAASVEYISKGAICSCNDIEAIYYYGDAPEGVQVLGQADKVTIYHLPDAKGWYYLYDRDVYAEYYEAKEYEIKTFCGVLLSDVPGVAYYAKPVVWAYNNNIVGGYEDMTFRPMDICTRAQMVTFLWRANGCPEPEGTAQGFDDVAEDAYYRKAVLWAAEQGIVCGFEDGSFRPDELVTRAQAVIFIWRSKGCPEPPERVWRPSDVSNTYAEDAVRWAIANDVAKGYSLDVFGAMDGCTRAQIVTFLYRAMA